MIKKIINTILIVTLGLTFVFSGVTKYLSIDIYEILLVKQGLSSWELTRFVSRLIIAFEITLGLLLLFHYRTKFLLKASLIILAVMSAFLGIQIVLGVQPENCFCFGDTLELNNTESILKNGILIFIAFIAFKGGPLFEIHKWGKWIVIGSSFFIVLTTVVILYPPINIYEEFSIDDFKRGDEFPKVSELPGDVYEGKVILAFLSPTCKHCELVAMKLAIIDEKVPYKIYPIFGFAESKIEGFKEKTGLKTESIIINKQDFLKFTKGVFPQIYLLENGKVESIFNKRLFMEAKLK